MSCRKAGSALALGLTRVTPSDLSHRAANVSQTKHQAIFASSLQLSASLGREGGRMALPASMERADTSLAHSGPQQTFNDQASSTARQDLF